MDRKAVFYCQLDYEHLPYPSPVGVSNGNLANNGCGVCAASMVAENFCGEADMYGHSYFLCERTIEICSEARK